MGPWLTTIGLVLDIVGVVILARGVIVTNEMAKTLAGTHWDRNTELEKKLRKGTRDGYCGVCILVVGFSLQILGTWAQ